MAIEVRYIIFTSDEVRAAVVAYVQKQGQVAAAECVRTVQIVGPNEAPEAVLQLQPGLGTKPIQLGEQTLAAALLLYCIGNRIPIPKRASKKVELTVNGLTLAMTTDQTQGRPSVGNARVSYGEIANRATEKIGTVQEELARALARAEYAEGLVAQAEERARRAEAARGKSSAALIAVAMLPGFRGRVGRWLVNFRPPVSD